MPSSRQELNLPTLQIGKRTLKHLALILLFWQWRPMGGVIWDVQEPTARGIFHGIYAAGSLIVLGTTFLLNHFDLFGLRQVCAK
jgi:protein-S-isoprenylcysteine O-methyltransferase Ste14